MAIPGRSYRIVAKHSGKGLDVSGGADANLNGADVQQYQDLGGNNQRWTLTEVEPGYYKIAAVHSGRALDVRGGAGATSNGALLQQYDYLGKDNQKFAILPLEAGYVRIVAKHSGKTLDVAGGAGAIGDGARIQQYDYLGGDNQKWQLVPLREQVVELFAPPLTQRLLDAARGVLEGELERQLRERANSDGLGRIGRIERLRGQWITDALIDAELSRIPTVSVELVRSLREKLSPPGGSPQHWLGYSLKWFVVDFLKQPIFDDDDCDVSIRAFLTWKVDAGRLVFSSAPIRVQDVEIDTGLSLTGFFISFIELLAGIFRLDGLVIVAGEQVGSIPAQLNNRIEIERNNLRIEIGTEEIGVKDLFIANSPPRFVATFGW